MSDMNIEVVYFGGNGRADALRMMLHYKGCKFTDTRLGLGEHLPYGQDGRSEWGGLPCACIDGEWYGQNKAIMRMLGNRLGLYPQNDPMLSWRIDSIVDFFQDELGESSRLT
jgi:hypothetical protein